MCTCRLATKNLGCQVLVHNLLNGALFVFVLLLRFRTFTFPNTMAPIVASFLQVKKTAVTGKHRAHGSKERWRKWCLIQTAILSMQRYAFIHTYEMSIVACVRKLQKKRSEHFPFWARYFLCTSVDLSLTLKRVALLFNCTW